MCGETMPEQAFNSLLIHRWKPKSSEAEMELTCVTVVAVCRCVAQIYAVVLGTL